jgi:hypothetical protein
MHCDKCNAVAAGPPPVLPTSARKPDSEGAAKYRFALLAGVASAMVLVCLLPIGGLWLAWVFSGNEKPSPDKPAAVEPITEEEISAAKKVKPPPPPDPRIKIVQPSVDKGVAFLKSQVPGLKGQRGGYVGLVGLALLECGVPPDDSAILQIADNIRVQSPSMNQIYDLAASLFFLNRWHELRPLDEKDSKMARSFALRIIAGQVKSGIWGYTGVVLNPEQEAKLVATLQDGTYKPAGAQVVSMSNTQFAMLAVWGARKHGVPVREPLLALAAYFHANQQADGCWNYPGHSLKATSTCAGLISLAIEVALLEDKEFTSTPRVHKDDPNKKKADIDKAFKFVAKTIGRKKDDPNPGRTLGYGGGLFDADAMGDLYFLWTLERVGVIYSKEKIEDKDWFDWGYPIVMAAQEKDGSWNEVHNIRFGPLIDTPFALLFLRRANIARDLTEIIRTRGGKEAIP